MSAIRKFSSLSFSRENASCRISGPDLAWWNVAGNYAAGADKGAFTDGNATQNGSIAADTGLGVDDRFHETVFPIGFRFKPISGGDGLWPVIIDKHDTVSDKAVVFYVDTFTDERMRGYFAVTADRSIFLNFNKSADPGIVADPAAVQIDEIGQEYVLTQ